jgi:hypothetical protein
MVQGHTRVWAVEPLSTFEPSGASSDRTLWHHESKRIDSDVAISLDFCAKLYYTMCARQRSNAPHLRAGVLAETARARGGKD